MLTVIGEGKRDNQGKRRLLVRCVCGAKKSWRKSQFERNISCGCMKRELCRVASTTHGLSGSKIFNVWNHMLGRCNNERNKSWPAYGGRGIRVCARWANSFEAFAEDMLPTYRDGLTIERKNNNKGYSKTNCIWVPLVLQAKNRRTTHRIHTPWGLMIAADAARKIGIGHSGLRKRIASWPKERWFEMPWTPKSGPSRHTKKATTPGKKKAWSATANAVLKESGDEGKAIRIANSVVKKRKGKR